MSSHTTPRRAWLALAVLTLPVLMISVDATVLGFAVPALSEHLAPTSSQLLWIVDIYSFVLSGLLVTMGTVGDRIGRRKLLLIGGAAFAAASLLAAWSSSAEMLIVARGVLGLAGATLMPSTLSLIRSVFTEPTARRTAVAIWGATAAGGAALGPIVGGWLLEHFWWGSLFLLNIPFMIVLLVFGPILVPESKDPMPGRFDPISVLLSMLAIFPLVYAVHHLAEAGIDTTTGACTAAGLIFGWLFIRRQRGLENPLIDVNLFKNPRFSTAVLSNVLGVMVIVGVTFFGTQYLQIAAGLQPIEAGLRILPGTIFVAVGSLCAARLMARYRLSSLFALGFAFMASGMATLLTVRTVDEAWLFAGLFVIVGFGSGLIETLSADSVLTAVPVERAGAASAISETAYEFGAACGTAVLGSLLTARYRAELTAGAPDGLPSHSLNAALDTFGGAFMEVAKLGGSMGENLWTVATSAFIDAMHVTSIVAAVLAALMAVLAFVILRRSNA